MDAAAGTVEQDGAAHGGGTGRVLPLVLWNGEVGHAALRAIDAAPFDPGAFARAHLACPPSIARSAPRRQAGFFHGRAAARQALAPFGLGHHDVGIGSNREPLWPAGTIGSITHSDRHAAAIALPSRGHGGIGIDIEECADEEGAAALDEVAINAAERAGLRALATDLPPACLLTLVFSAKESFYKAAFRQVGRFFDFSAVDVTHVDLAGRSLRLTVREHLSPGLPVGSVQRVPYLFLDPVTVFTSCSLPP